MAIQASPRSTVDGIVWPALPGQEASLLLALQQQLEQSEWWSAEHLEAMQLAQLAVLARHAATTTPLYRRRFAEAGLAPDGRALSMGDLRRLPLLTRPELVASEAELRSEAYPEAHGTRKVVATSRATGRQARVISSGVSSILWMGFTLRDHRWHRRDLTARLASLRYLPDGVAPPPDGLRQHGWGPAVDAIYPPAPLSTLTIDSTVEQQVAWLRREAPAYLLVYPSVLDAMVRRLRRTGETVPSLRQVRTVSEALSDETRALVEEVLGVPLVDLYSAQEVGYIALQCPDAPGYHVQSEGVLVEVLDDDGQPCAAGQVGRVVVTSLHNYASPLLRYEIGDYAEVGPPCPCGRGLPALRRVVGRRRGMLVYPDGRTVFPVFTVRCRAAARYAEIQVEQRTLEQLIVRVVPDGAFTPADERALVKALLDAFGHPFDVVVEVVEALARGGRGKLEEFVSRVAEGGDVLVGSVAAT